MPVHIHPAYASYGKFTYVATFRKPSTTLDIPYCSWEKKASDTTPSPAEWSAGPQPSFSPNTAIEAVMKANHLLTIDYIGLLDP
jgi:hypothetical protein